MYKIRALAVVGLLSLLICGPVAAQLTRGFISGTLQDPAGAVMGGAKVAAINKSTGIRVETETNGLGAFRFVAIEPGMYDVEFSKSGFETKRIANILLTATQEVVLNQSINIASATTTIEVVDAPPGVELSKASATIERKLDITVLANVSLSGTRDINQLALLAPTANRAPGSTGVGINGQRARNNNYLLDGVDNNDPSVTIANNRIVPEAVSEFQVQAQAYSAEFGRNTGGQIQVITRSGTNQFHGEVYDYYRGNWMEPVSLLNKRQGLIKTPVYVHNQPGGSIGGPILKNRTFFFSNIDLSRRREAPSAGNASSATIPTPAGFTALQNLPLADGQSSQSRQAVLGGIGFLSKVYPLVGNYTNRRTTSVNGVPIEIGTINLPLSNPANFWNYTAKVDHHLSSKDSLSYRLQMDKRSQPDVVSNLQFAQLFSGAQTILGQNHALSETHTFGTHFVNEFRAAFVRRILNFPENDPKTPSTTISGLFTIGGLNNFPQGRTQNTFEFQNVSTLLSGKHSLKFGVDMRRLRLYNIAAFDSKGTFGFDNLQDYMNNRAATFTQAINTATFDARQTQQAWFFQDDFRATKNLTFNLGIRYETAGVPFGFFGAKDAESLNAGVPGPVKRDKNNWAPRAGFAYSPSAKDGFLRKLLGDGETVFRGGYGVGYDVLFFNILTVNASNYPRVVVNTADRASLANVWPGLLPPPPGGVKPPFDPRAAYVISPVDTQNPTAHFYSFSIQRQFSKSYVFEVAYVGSRSYHGVRQGQLNPGILTQDQAATVRRTLSTASIPGLPGSTLTVNNLPSRRLNPAWGGRTTIETTALGNYNGMYVKLDKRLSHGLTIGGNYTWSANLSDNDESLGVGAITNSSPQIPQDYYNYRNEWGRSAFDVPHRFSFYFNYEVPWFTAPALNNTVTRRIFKGLSVSGFTDFQSGQPFTIRTGVDTAGTGTAGPHRPSYNPSGKLTFDPVAGDYRTFTTAINGTGIVSTFLNPSNGLPLANSVAFPLASDNLGRNTFRGPGTVLWNSTVQKSIEITERWKVILRADWVNTFNHRNFGNPVVTMNSPIFGQNTSDPGGRTMLMSARVRF